MAKKWYCNLSLIDQSAQNSADIFVSMSSKMIVSAKKIYNCVGQTANFMAMGHEQGVSIEAVCL